ncbi:hypothetical protein A2Z33_07690 [Candidatus Gottesmanbacteria bacterium RBG_16_52_11]|uniref:M23ase beta-sheet core domain-containing protein n=1 Tax=Candidatus Gottesmanbacteria bacterium RBG_16_52_11 TaxID=1798374 RepID=A0A1F5YN69_9BACT|nr:MAG: hypothetical protein A2Z33_07690 [Candidatus Gottesmanbacteria bacterium RBG_16_52_11]
MAENNPGSAPATQSGQAPAINPELLRIVYFAQIADPQWYAKTIHLLFQGQEPPIPWSLEDPRFLAVMDEFERLFSERFGQVEEEAMENTVPKDTVEGFIREYEEHLSQRKLRREQAATLSHDIVEQLRRQGVRLSEQERIEIANRLAQASVAPEAAADASGYAARVAGGIEETVRGHPTAVSPESMREAIAPVAASSWESWKQESQIRETITRSALVPEDQQYPTRRPDVYVGIYRRLVDESPDKSSEAVRHLGKTASEVTAAAEPMLISAPAEGESRVAGEFITSLSKPGFSGIVGTLVSVMDPVTRVSTARTIVSGSVERILGNSQLLTDRLGKDFVSSDIFQFIADKAQASLADRGRGGGIGGFTGAVSSVAGTVLTGPISSAMITPPDQSFIRFLEAMALGSRTPVRLGIGKAAAGGGALAAGALSALAPGQISRTVGMPGLPARLMMSQLAIFRPHAYAQMLPTVFPPLINPSGLAPQYSQFFRRAQAGIILLAPIAALAGVLGLKPRLPMAPVPIGGRRGLGRLAPQGVPGGSIIPGPLRGILPRLPGFGFMSGIIGSGIDRIISGTGGGILGFTHRLQSPLFAGREEVRMINLITIVIISAVGLIMIFPPQITNIKNIILGSGGFGAEYNDDILPGDPAPWTWDGDAPPYTGDLLCPTTGHITDGPPHGKYGNLIAWDIGANIGTPVYATHDGAVTECKDYIENDNHTTEGGGYGNYVKIVGEWKDTPNCSGRFFTMYAHLKQYSPTEAGVCSPGKKVKAGDKIGEVDNNGISSGNHLHYEYQGPNWEKCFGLPDYCPGKAP